MRKPTIEGILNLWRINTTRADVPKTIKRGFKNSNSMMPSLLLYAITQSQFTPLESPTASKLSYNVYRLKPVYIWRNLKVAATI